MQSRLAHSITYRLNVLYDYSSARMKWSASKDKQCWDVMEGELLFNVEGKTPSNGHQRPRMACLSNTSAISDPTTAFKFAGVALGNMSHNDRMMPQGFAAMLEGTCSIINTGKHKIMAGQDVYVYIDNTDENTAARQVRGVPNDKKLLVTCNAEGTSGKNVRHIGKALSSAAANQRLDMLIC